MFIGGIPSPARYIGIRTLGRISFQSLEKKRLRGKVLIAWDLASFALGILALRLAAVSPRGAGPPFHPE
jgi:hypothetical protein